MGSQRVGHDWATDLIWCQLLFLVQLFYFAQKEIGHTKVTCLKSHESTCGRGSHFVSSCLKDSPCKHVCVLTCFSRVRLLVTLWTVACQTPLSMGCSKQEYWNGLPCPPPGNLPNSGMETMSLMSPALAGRCFFFLPLEPPGKPNNGPYWLFSILFPLSDKNQTTYSPLRK